MTQRPTESGVERLPTSVSDNFRRQPGKQASEGLSAVALQGKKVFELVYDPLDDLPLSCCPSSCLRWPCPPGALLRSSGNQCPVLLQPVPLPLHRRVALVRKEGVVVVGGHQELSDGPLV